MPRTINEEYEQVDVRRLKIHPANPRQGDLGLIGESIKTNGFFGAVVAQKSTGYVLAGNHRLMAAEQQGMATVPVIWVDVGAEEAVRILLADNKTSDDASYDQSVLSDLLAGLAASDGGLVGTGWNADELDKLIGDLAEPLDLSDPDPPTPVECPSCGHCFTPTTTKQKRRKRNGRT